MRESARPLTGAGLQCTGAEPLSGSMIQRFRVPLPAGSQSVVQRGTPGGQHDALSTDVGFITRVITAPHHNISTYSTPHQSVCRISGLVACLPCTGPALLLGCMIQRFWQLDLGNLACAPCWAVVLFEKSEPHDDSHLQHARRSTHKAAPRHTHT